MHDFELIELDRLPVERRPARDPGSRPMLVAAQTDTELARAFLAHAVFAKSTLKSTKTELCRFLWWCRDQRLHLADLRVEDMAAYRDFLLDPQPREKWVSASAYKPTDPRYNPDCGTRWPRTDSRWRPFSGPLSVQSARQAFRVARALTAFAKETGYLEIEPGKIVKNHTVVRTAAVERYLGPATITYVDAAVAALPRTTEIEKRRAARDRFVFVAFVTTGARLSEIAEAKMGAIHLHDNRWWLRVTGKGNKERLLPVCGELLECYREYRMLFELPASTYKDDPDPMVLSVRRKAISGIGAEATANIITRLFGLAADLAKQDNNIDACNDLSTASAHWLRHEMITAIVNYTGDIKMGQELAGHNDIATTGGYLHSLANDRHNAVLALMKKRRT